MPKNTTTTPASSGWLADHRARPHQKRATRPMTSAPKATRAEDADEARAEGVAQRGGDGLASRCGGRIRRPRSTRRITTMTDQRADRDGQADAEHDAPPVDGHEHRGHRHEQGEHDQQHDGPAGDDEPPLRDVEGALLGGVAALVDDDLAEVIGQLRPDGALEGGGRLVSGGSASSTG